MYWKAMNPDVPSSSCPAVLLIAIGLERLCSLVDPGETLFLVHDRRSRPVPNYALLYVCLIVLLSSRFG